MAFFKFRFPGQNTVSATEGNAVPAASLEAVRRQARFRLIGAALLVLVAVVVFPLVFDTQPRPVAVDTPILVPDRQAALPMNAATLPASQTPARPQTIPEVDSARTPAPAPSPSAQAQEPQSLPAAQKRPEASVNPASAAHSVATPSPVKPPAQDKSAPSRKTVDAHDDGTRAKALLDGDKTAAKSVAAERHILQVGAYTDNDKAREVRRKLEQAGLKTYTQAVEGKDGKRVVRVRIGPFDSKAEADKAAARVRKLDLPVSLLRL